MGRVGSTGAFLGGLSTMKLPPGGGGGGGATAGGGVGGGGATAGGGGGTGFAGGPFEGCVYFWGVDTHGRGRGGGLSALGADV